MSGVQTIVLEAKRACPECGTPEGAGSVQRSRGFAGVIAATLLGLALVVGLVLNTQQNPATALSGPQVDMQFIGPKLTLGDLRRIASGAQRSPVSIEWFDRVHHANRNPFAVYPDNTQIQITFDTSDMWESRELREFGWPLPGFTVGHTATSAIDQPSKAPTPSWRVAPGGITWQNGAKFATLRLWVILATLIMSVLTWRLLEAATRWVTGSRNTRARRIAFAAAILLTIAMLGWPSSDRVVSPRIVGISGTSTMLTLGDIRSMAKTQDPVRDLAERLLTTIDRMPLSPMEKAAKRSSTRSDDSVPLLVYLCELDRPRSVATWSNPVFGEFLTVWLHRESDLAAGRRWYLWHERGAVQGVFWRSSDRSVFMWRMTDLAIGGFVALALCPLSMFILWQSLATAIRTWHRRRSNVCLNCGYSMGRSSSS